MLPKGSCEPLGWEFERIRRRGRHAAGSSDKRAIRERGDGRAAHGESACDHSPRREDRNAITSRISARDR